MTVEILKMTNPNKVSVENTEVIIRANPVQATTIESAVSSSVKQPEKIEKVTHYKSSVSPSKEMITHAFKPLTSSRRVSKTITQDYDDSLYSFSYSSSYPRETISRQHAGKVITSAVMGSYDKYQQVKPKNPAIVAIVEGREREKRELTVLNDKFASYVERVRFLEVHNKKLQMELEALKSRSGGDPIKIGSLYDEETQKKKRQFDEAKIKKELNESKVVSIENQSESIRYKYNEALNYSSDSSRIDVLNKQIAENEAEINVLKRKLGDLEDEVKRYKTETQRLISEIQYLSSEIDSEDHHRIQLEKKKSSLEQEVTHLRQTHSQNLHEVRQDNFMDYGIDSSQFFKSELANAIREIREEYDQITANQQFEMDKYYSSRLQEVEIKRPESTASSFASIELKQLRVTVSNQRREISSIKAKNAEVNSRIKEIEELISLEQKEGTILIEEQECELLELKTRQRALLSDYDELNKMKTSLEGEIETYRRLLEGEGGQKDGLKQVVEGIEERVRKIHSISGSQDQSSLSFTSSVQTGGKYHESIIARRPSRERIFSSSKDNY